MEKAGMRLVSTEAGGLQVGGRTYDKLNFEYNNASDSTDLTFRMKQGTFNYRVGAIIIHDGKLLLMHNEEEPYYYTVGGRVHFNETTEETVVREVREEIGIDLEQRGIELNYSNMVPPGTRIIADPEQMKRVINNIVGNSVKYIDKPHGRIDIRILDEEDSIRVEIEDNGKGIGARDLPYIFDRFYRTDSSRNSSQGGSGIGLSIVKKVIEDHGGYIWATSTLGEGTCMHFVLRKYMEQNRAAQSESWTV
jgi:signal transduction histidine kinase